MLYEEAVQKFDVDAMYSLEKIYETGLGVAVDLKRAWRLYVDAHLHGAIEGTCGMERLDQIKDGVEVKEERKMDAAVVVSKRKRSGRS